MNRQGLKYMPQVFENGWYCACGSFHPKEEDTVYCTECGCDRILLQNALNTLLQPEKKEPVPAAEPVRPVQTEPDERTRIVGAAPVPPEEPTRIVGSVPPRTEPDAEATRVMPPRTTLRPSAEEVDRPASFAPPLENAPDAESTRVLDDDEGTRVIPARGREAVRPAEPEDAEEEEQTEARDGVAETLIRWVPPLTAILCAGIALWGFVYYQFMM